MKKPTPQLHELLLQALTHEQGGEQVYRTALECAVNEDLHEEWEKYLGETKRHVEVLQDACAKLGIETSTLTPGCEIVEHQGKALVQAMKMAQKAGDREAAELVACECVVLAETKDHLNWELIGRCAEKAKGEEKKVLKAAYEEVEDEEDEHLYHTKGWCRELWIQSLGMRAVLPPPEEEKHVKTAIGASRAKQESLKSR
jgi:hypothetical protein